MQIWKFTVKATREMFMEPARRETMERYVAADSYEQAHSHVWATLNRGGWTVDSIRSEPMILEDIRAVP